ncbi:VOC family protein [Kribbella qitaiheensis]|uniref:VOC family protein n=1 Tax=Kribbella qitaiheensis TaxID=1544730 RepID=A0A7G6WTG7_9ACTN|nr:VOC family protein [Kribbella qitaiheensis]QNE17282.1 VOC family protein [Kribbella qitaiheensis]
MTSHLVTLSFDANDPTRLAQFWAGVIGRKVADDGITLLANDDSGFAIRFTSTEEKKTEPNQMHFDLTSKSLEDQQQIVARALELGGRHIDIGQLPEEKDVVLADPEGNEFCVVEPGNNFLADTGVIGAFSSDGSQAVGYFWSKALDWPLVWDENEETAIQSAQGGSKISWGGPPVREKTAKNRLAYELAADGDQQAEVDRLVALGATRVDSQGDVVAMLDPDGNEFSVVPA